MPEIDSIAGSVQEESPRYMIDLRPSRRRFPAAAMGYSLALHAACGVALIFMPPAVSVLTPAEVVSAYVAQPADILLPDLRASGGAQGGGSGGSAGGASGGSTGSGGAGEHGSKAAAGGSSGGANTKPSGMSSPSGPGRMGLAYQGRQAIISNPPHPDNSLQTIRQPDLVRPPRLSFPVSAPNQVLMAAAAPPPQPVALQLPRALMAPTPDVPAPRVPSASLRASTVPIQQVLASVKVAVPAAPPPEPPPIQLRRLDDRVKENVPPVLNMPVQTRQPAMVVSAQPAMPSRAAPAPAPMRLRAEKPRSAVADARPEAVRLKSQAALPRLQSAATAVPVLAASAAAPDIASLSGKGLSARGTDAMDLLVVNAIETAGRGSVPPGERLGQFTVVSEPRAPGQGVGTGGTSGEGSGAGAETSGGGMGEAGTGHGSAGGGTSGAGGGAGGAAGGGSGSGAGGGSGMGRGGGPGAGSGGGPGRGNGAGVGNGSGSGTGTGPGSGIGRGGNGAGGTGSGGAGGTGRGAGGRGDGAGGSGTGRGAGSGQGPGSGSGTAGGSGSGNGSGPGSGTGSGSGTGAGTGDGNGGNSIFPDISIVGGTSGGGGAHGAAPAAGPRSAGSGSRIAPGSYGLTIMGLSGGGLKDFGIFRNEQVYTVYLDMSDADPPAGDWTLQYALLTRPERASEPAPYSVPAGSGMLEAPFPRAKQSPALSPELRKRYAGRSLVVYGVITTEGKLTGMRLVQCPDALMEKPTLEALQTWKFDPAEVNGRAADVKVLIGIPISGR